ncbi:MAG TPA: PP2C family protein-serine/threonine phosphatase [Polyangia bacterium]|nr:PP2C family protein-serine/threonine phosphatase [Polyangia bacterium]
MKTLDFVSGGSAALLIDSAVRAASRVPVEQALGAIGEPETVVELAQRLVTTISMLWADVAGADLVLPHGAANDLRAVADPVAGHALLSAVSVPREANAAFRIVSESPNLVPGDAGLGFGSSMSAPIAGAETTAGWIVVQRRAAAPEFAPHDLTALAALARGLSPVLPRVQARGQTTATWFQHDLASAREMQRMFLPRPLEHNSARVRVLAEYLPAFAVGGDFYDLIDLGDGRLLAAIGDVSGKGVTAALMMSRISSELRRLAVEAAGPAEILSRLNDSLPGRMQDDRFVTVACVLLDAPNRRWVVSNAGHVPPILRRLDGSVRGVAYASGPPIGMIPSALYEEDVIPAESKDILLLSTDGVFELFSGHHRPSSTIGQSRLADLIEKAPHDLAEINKRIIKTVESAASGRDDVALLGLELTD